MTGRAAILPGRRHASTTIVDSSAREDDQLRRLIEEYHDFVTKHPDSVRLALGVLLREVDGPNHLLVRLSELHRVYRDLLAEVLERGRRRGILLQRLLGDQTTASGALLDHLRTTFVDTLRR